MALFRKLPQAILEDIFSLLPPQDSGSLSKAHPLFGRIYHYRIWADSINAETWQEFAALVNEVLDHHPGDRPLESLSIRLREYFAVDQYTFNTAVSRWLIKARVHRVSDLDLHGKNSICIRFKFIDSQDLKKLQLKWVDFSELYLRLQLTLMPPLYNLQSLTLQRVRIEPHTNLGLLLAACPNLKVFVLEDCYGIGALNINCPLLHTLDVSHLRFDWTVTIINLPVLTDLNVWSRDLPNFRLLQHPISTAPIPPSAQDSVANVKCLLIMVDGNLPLVIRFIQYFHHSLDHLILLWKVTTKMEYQVVNTQELEELKLICIGGVPLYDEPLQVMVEYLLAHSPKLITFTLMYPRHLYPQVLEENNLSKIKSIIKELPRSSQQAKFKIIWSDSTTNDNENM